MTLWNHYHTPVTVDEALSLLDSYQGRARVVAGGTDLLLDMRHGHMPPVEALVDISRIPELGTLGPEESLISDEGLMLHETLMRIGANVTHAQIVKSAVLAERATCLVESSGVVGGPQVRNVGTLGGNVAHALPAGDGTTSLVALDAETDVVLDGTRRWLPLRDLFVGPGQSRLDSCRDLLLGFRFRLCGVNEASAFKRIMRPQGVALPILGCAAWLRLDTAGEQVEDVRICIGPVAKVPMRAAEVEQAVRGQPAGDETIERAVSVARETLYPRTSKYRATAEYRHEMIEVLLRRVLPLTIERARTGQATPEGVGLE